MDYGVAKFNASPKQVAQTGILELQAQAAPYEKPVRRKSFFRRALSTFTGSKAQEPEGPVPTAASQPAEDGDGGKPKRRRSFASLRRRASGKGRKSMDLSKPASEADKAKAMAKSQRLVARHGTNESEPAENEGVRTRCLLAS